MSLLSLSFISLFILLLIIYWTIPDRFRNIVLLFFSWGYVLTWSWIYLLFLVGAVIISYLAGIWIGNSATNKKKLVILSISLVVLIGALVIVKYTNAFLAVLGISFFTFQAVSYVIDVYRGDVEIEKNFVVYALFVSFFPQLAAGPIAKAKEQIGRYKKARVFDLVIVEKAVVVAIYGFFLKMVIADRIGIFVDSVYANVNETGRIPIILAVLLYSVQIYCDFEGYSLIAVGIGRSLGIELPTNFKQPYLANNIGDFWKKWHISLTSWFRDYLYFPLGGNRKGKLRTCLNIIIVFVVSGMWHGVGGTFFVWGLLHGVLYVAERLFIRTKKNYRVLTYIVVSWLWVFFRADNVSHAWDVMQNIIINPKGMEFSGVLVQGLNVANLILLVIAMVVMIIIDVNSSRDVKVVDKIFEMKLPIRWIVLYALIIGIIVFGVYGPGYDATRFIYDKF